MFLVSSLYLTTFECTTLAETARFGVFFRRQLHDNYAVYWIFKALSRHKSFDFMKDMVNTLYKHASSLLLDSITEQIELA